MNKGHYEAGEKAYQIAQRIFPIHRSLTGDGVRSTLKILKEYLPELDIKEVPSGTRVFDWTIPKEWNCREAYIEDEDGNRIIDVKDNNLYVLGYAAPEDRWVTLEELKGMVFTQPDQPDWIPYVTSYYKERSGFCMSQRQLEALEDGKNYHIVIDSELKKGFLTYADCVISGRSTEEILISTYICHPSMANNECSGPALAVMIADWIKKQARKYTYRFVFVPETIGSIMYIQKHFTDLKNNLKAGFILSCVGDNRTYSFVETRYGNTITDRVLDHVMRHHTNDYTRYPFLKRGSDERQYNAPGIDLPVCSISRSKYGEYPEYHTSADNMELISGEGFQGAFEMLLKCIQVLEANEIYRVNVLGEPQLGKRNLYPSIGFKNLYNQVMTMLDFIAYADGTNDLIAIGDLIGVSAYDLIPLAETLKNQGLIDEKR